MADVTPERVREMLDALRTAPKNDAVRAAGWLMAAAPDLARAYLAEHERADLWRGVWSGSHDSHVRTVDEARAEIAALRERAERAERALEERDGDMHARIRAGYDRAIADSWRAEVARVTAERDEARATRDQASEDAAAMVAEAERARSERDIAVQRAERAEAEAARLREAAPALVDAYLAAEEVVDAAREVVADVLDRFAVHGPVPTRLRNALARLDMRERDGGGR